MNCRESESVDSNEDRDPEYEPVSAPLLKTFLKRHGGIACSGQYEILLP